jgi:hypothetical protein
MVSAMPSPRRCAIALVLSLLCPSATPSFAESVFALDPPEQFGTFAAGTFDDAGLRLGPAELEILELDTGLVRLRTRSRLESGGQMQALAEFARIGTSGKLRVKRQQMQSLDESGNSLGVLSLDHVAGKARCAAPSGSVTSELDLAPKDRVVNVPMGLLFQPLARGERKRLRFQILLCRPEARILDFEAWVESRPQGRAIEVRYAPDLGFASFVARAVTPKLAFWFDPAAPHHWMAHRVPLYSGGPEVTVVREGVPSVSLGR